MTASITCPVCEKTSHNPNDVSAGYCGHCHDYTGAADLQPVGWQPGAPAGDVLHYDRQGHPITLNRFCWLYEPSMGNKDLSYSRLADDELPDGLRICTDWLGNNYNLAGAPPIIFETVIFVDGKNVAGEQYSTEAEALAKHATLKRSLELVGRAFLEDELRQMEQHDEDSGGLIVFALGIGEVATFSFDELPREIASVIQAIEEMTSGG